MAKDTVSLLSFRATKLRVLPLIAALSLMTTPLMTLMTLIS